MSSYCADLSFVSEHVDKGTSNSRNLVLILMLDLANHDPGARMTWVVSTDSVILTMADLIKAGARVFNNYEPKGTEERK